MVFSFECSTVRCAANVYADSKLRYDSKSSKARRSVSLNVSTTVKRGEMGRFLMFIEYDIARPCIRRMTHAPELEDR